VVPAENFGRHFKEWREGHPSCVDSKGKSYKGRRCASRVSAKFREMEADRINLVPAIGQVNALRSNYRYYEIPGEKRKFGKCDIEIEGRKFEPPEDKKGDVARIYRYMSKKYGISLIGRQASKLFEVWEKGDPISKEECIRVRNTFGELGIFKGLCNKQK